MMNLQILQGLCRSPVKCRKDCLVIFLFWFSPPWLRFLPGIRTCGSCEPNATSERAIHRKPSRIWRPRRSCATTTAQLSWSSACCTTAWGNTTSPSSEAPAKPPLLSGRPLLPSHLPRPPLLLLFQSRQGVPEAGPGWQGLLQPLQAGEEAQQTAGLCRGAHSRGEVCVLSVRLRRDFNGAAFHKSVFFVCVCVHNKVSRCHRQVWVCDEDRVRCPVLHQPGKRENLLLFCKGEWKTQNDLKVWSTEIFQMIRPNNL